MVEVILAGEHGFELHVRVGIEIWFGHRQLVQQVYLGLVRNRLGKTESTRSTPESTRVNSGQTGQPPVNRKDPVKF
ncbi:hypothetical protein HanRHA438_Chr06g0282111 [Helianthus annuus]|uniref:Uncharacterized protein n=1 Tax=Helianthus annuus TaxID=4232 RepID=A0A9K3IV46_HELAN|nr:hypothetical protein HanXRQr2_Chr06g0273061 [Helianthus annuus]KAJ0913133.1 hypothetical protein HanRHA438_Chr06g0282111 [Helianthus annuus]